MSSKVYAYNPGSRSARALAFGLNIRRLRHAGSTWIPRRSSTVLNWGSSNLPDNILASGATIINHPARVAECSNKLKFFRKVGDGPVPPYGTTRQWAEDLMRETGRSIVCRTTLQGHSGEGIVVANDEADLVPAPLYTEYIKKADEYRVHVSTNGVFDIQKKARALAVPDDEVNWQVRSHANGFIYARGFDTVHDCVTEAAVDVFTRIGLDFGAVDVIYNRDRGAAHVLEINTAPGLEGTTLEKYVAEMGRLLRTATTTTTRSST